MHELKPHHLTLVRLAHTEKRLRHVGLVDHNLISRARAAPRSDGRRNENNSHLVHTRLNPMMPAQGGGRPCANIGGFS